MSHVKESNIQDIKPNKWTVCPKCHGEGRKSQGITKKAKRQYQWEYDRYKESGYVSEPPIRPKGYMNMCQNCKGSGLFLCDDEPQVHKDNYPHVAIVGGGLSGIALAVACFHRGIPFTLYERDMSFDARSQGYGLTLQQASKAIAGFGIMHLEGTIRTTRHLVHSPDGKVIGEWGKKKKIDATDRTKQKNIHVSRQGLRMSLLAQLHGSTSLQWGHRLMDFSQDDNGKIDLRFEVDGKEKKCSADLLVGADGIRSIVRQLSLAQDNCQLKYTGNMVVLGICSYELLQGVKSSLLDGETVFQTVNGHERIYVMPYSLDAVMWQVSFPLPESDALFLSSGGALLLKSEVIKRLQWHEPIPQMLSVSPESLITGYPIYDRDPITPEDLSGLGNVTIIGDAAHPMSPFKGQGANQALLDALALARGIYSGCGTESSWRDIGIRKAVLEKFESEMIERSGPKVRDSAEAARLLHSDAVMHEGDEPRGRGIGE